MVPMALLPSEITLSGPRPQLSPEVRRVAKGQRSHGCGNPVVTGRVAQTLLAAHKEAALRAASAAAPHCRKQGQRPPPELRRHAAPPPHAPPTAARFDQYKRRASGSTEVGLTSLRVGWPVSGARRDVGVVLGGPRLGELFTRGGSRGEAILGPLADLGVRISPLSPALPQMSGLAHSSPILPA
ncbi:unnamed protein product [Rangifer tarandus platyrhynchus]|uniref:Uncharacterized protein n=1 Tax=Rangifer tarandus platyrhynchus TaxID=3082113 RepID=A0AC60A844_RANTA